MPSVVTPERFASGMTFDQYVAFIGSPENLARENSGGLPPPRRDYSAYFREAFERRQLNPAQTAALQWLVAQPGGPAKILVMSEDWSSDCRRDIPTLARMAEVGGMELRIFARDGQKFSAASVPSLADARDSNADIMAEFLLEKDGGTWQSIPMAAFFDKDLNFLYKYQEYPAIYDKDRLVVDHIRGPRPGETPRETAIRGLKEFDQLFTSYWFDIWISAAVDEMLSALQRRLVLGAV